MDVVYLSVLLAGILPVLFFVTKYALYWLRIIIIGMKIPGPKPIPLLGNVNIYTVPLKDSFDMLRQHFERNKFFTVWVGPVPILMLQHPDHIKVVLRSPTNINKPFQYKFCGLGNGVLTARDDTWRNHRKLILPAFHFTMLQKYAKVFCKKCEILVKKLEKEVDGKSFEMHNYIFKCAMDSLLETATGNESNAQDEEIMNENEKIIQVCKELFMRRAISPWLYPDSIYWMSSQGKYFKYMKETHLDGRAIEEINRRKEYMNTQDNDGDMQTGGRKKMVFLDVLLEASTKENKLSDEDLLDEVNTFILVGQDSTAYSICWTLQILGANQEIQDQVYEEQYRIFQNTTRQPTLEDVAAMKYLEMVLKETARLYATVPVIGRTLSEDIEIDGYKVPAGMNVAIIPYLTHRMSEFYREPEKFNPDNFLPEKEASRHPYAYIPFSAGPRNCPGIKYAMTEMKIMISYIIRNYRVHSIRDKLTPLPYITLQAEEGFHMYITRRK